MNTVEGTLRYYPQYGSGQRLRHFVGHAINGEETQVRLACGCIITREKEKESIYYDVTSECNREECIL